MGIFSQNVYAVINALLSVKLSGLKMGQCNWFNICFMFVSSSKFIWFILFVWYLFRIFFSLYIYSILTIFFIFDSSCICIGFFKIFCKICFSYVFIVSFLLYIYSGAQLSCLGFECNLWIHICFHNCGWYLCCWFPLLFVWHLLPKELQGWNGKWQGGFR